MSEKVCGQHETIFTSLKNQFYILLPLCILSYMKCKLNVYSTRCNLYYERCIPIETAHALSFCGFNSIRDFPLYSTYLSRRSRFNNPLWARRSGVRKPVETKFSVPFQTTQHPIQWINRPGCGVEHHHSLRPRL
jgi:hypothetical protein